VGTIQGGAVYSIAPDHLGAPYKIVNSANAQVWVWDHDPFGNGAPTAAAGFWHRLRFPGQVYDSESKLHSNGQRDYDPRLGRYVESDPIGLEGGINTYAYANNNPVNSVDPTGTVVESWWDAGNVAMGLYSFVDNLINGNYAAAGVDFLGLGVDAAAAALPGVPGGAAWAIRTARAAAEGAAPRIIEGVDASILARSHSISGRSSSRLVNDIADGMRSQGYAGDAIKVIESDGRMIIVDGHHRAAAAIRTGTSVNVEVIGSEAFPMGTGGWQSVQEVIQSSVGVGPNRLRPPGR
jgi:RHS repeat-associated protein